MNDSPAIIADDMFSDARIQMIREQVAKGAPNDVFAAMIDIAKRRNLDPLSKQIALIKFGGTWQMIVTIDGYRAIADQTGRYAGMDAPVFTYDDPPRKTGLSKEIPESATVTVYKLVNGMRCPFSATVFWDEYATTTGNWPKMPRTMLAKVAESHALRKAFPAVLSGTYTAEEMDQAGAVETTGRVVDPLRHVPNVVDEDGVITSETGMRLPASAYTVDEHIEMEGRQQAQRPPRRPQPARSASVPANASPDAGKPVDMRAEALGRTLHGIAEHDFLHAVAVGWGFESFADVPADNRKLMLDFLNGEGEPAKLQAFNASVERWEQKYKKSARKQAAQGGLMPGVDEVPDPARFTN